MKTIPLTQGKVALVDDEDFDRLNCFKWHFFTKNKRTQKGYARRRVYPGRREDAYFLRMHRFIMEAPKGLQVDHRDCDGLNNQKSNLRAATHPQNCYNKEIGPRNTSGYKGVVWDKQHKKWRAQIKFQRKYYCLGLFQKAEDAARAYDAKAIELFGEFAHTNFKYALAAH